MKSNIDNLREILRKQVWTVNDHGHGEDHHVRVQKLSLEIANKIAKKVDEKVLSAAALTHDLHRLVAEDYVEPKESLDRIEELLDEADFSGDKENVLHCVEVHEEYPFQEEDEKIAETIEAEILQDADNLDALGAIGIARTFYFGGQHNNPMYDRAPNTSSEYDKTETSVSTVQHFHDKLERLDEAMNTDVAEEIAERRITYMQKFFKKLEKEIQADLDNEI